MANRWRRVLVVGVAASCLAFWCVSGAMARAAFPDTLVLSFDRGPDQASLQSRFRYVDVNGDTWTVPKGYVTNGASIPRVLWSIVGAPFTGAYREAAVVHDYLCDEQVSTSSRIHRLFRDAMLDSGVPTFQAEVMYRSVVAFGPKWPGFTGERAEMTKEDLQKLVRDVCGSRTSGGCAELKTEVR